jgi:adenylate kinase
MLGPPGCGKGTQSAHIKDHFALAHLATGDMLRAAVARGTPIGKRAKSFMDAGQLVPDEVVLEVVAEAIKDEQCRNGFIFDGFPRTLNQAEKVQLIHCVLLLMHCWL